MKHLKITIFIFNFLIWLSGFMTIVIGTWLLIEPSSGHLFNLFMKILTPHDTVHLLSYSVLCLGMIVLTVGFVGCRASLYSTPFILTVYIGILMILIIVELATAAVGGFMSYRAISGLENRLLKKMSEDYGHDSTSDIAFSHSLDFAQYKFNCCGIYGDSDYNGTAWWRDGRLSGTNKDVPLTCCVLKNHETKNAGSPMSVVSRVFHKDNEKPWLHPQPKDQNACEASDPEAHINFRNKDGCLKPATNWLRKDSLKLVFLEMGMVFLQAIAIAASAVLYRSIRDMQEY